MLEDDVLKHVKAAWRRIVGEAGDEGFMAFGEREGMETVEEGVERDAGEM